MLKQNKQQVIETRDRQFSKGMVVAMSCEILKINDETYRVQSESAVDRYYIVRFLDGEPTYCTCKNYEINSHRNANHMCKHMNPIIYASVNGLIIEQVPTRPLSQPSDTEKEVNNYLLSSKQNESRLVTFVKQQSSSWRDSLYDF
jgi:hypothetical protein